MRNESTARYTVSGISDVLRNRNAGFLGYHRAVETAVLVALKQQQGVLHVLFERRSFSLRRQPGEISFPGGHVEATDRSQLHAAVRETGEELGINQDTIRVLGSLDIFPASSGLLVYPYVGFLPDDAILRPNPKEVANILSVPLQTLLEHEPDMYRVHLQPEFPEDFPFHLIPNGRAYPFRTDTQVQYFYQFDDFVVWGLTAKVLTHFLDLLR
ncbi:CoA pyrophosphatase [Alicyclobacillus sp. SO9]|uniref:NUDIX hydrolase n=1 Tax=Alicyclobacillus sp. SO9 TaxID=2665646 RepID=UPI0018E8E519|nr:CoA pyrophosphatase [Alicyclobacillus sp. SO9]QQE81034.1 CoA pyrophosphatase [Alicyclobacillus sp. SO9]